MFTGIVTDIGTIHLAEQRGDLRLTIGCGFGVDDVAIGASIACNGCCLTVVDKGVGGHGGPGANGATLPDGPWFAVDASAETIACTAPGMWAAGQRLNLERALKVGDELGGHIVTGHVDGVGVVDAITQDGDSHRVAVRIARELAPFVAAKGSITVDGVSLTVNAVADDAAGCVFQLNIIPHTWDVTTFAGLATGQSVNIEIDTLARYLQRMRDVLGG
ncbi:MAG: riboflavin synthase [Sphingopyxis sp.]